MILGAHCATVRGRIGNTLLKSFAIAKQKCVAKPKVLGPHCEALFSDCLIHVGRLIFVGLAIGKYGETTLMGPIVLISWQSGLWGVGL